MAANKDITQLSDRHVASSQPARCRSADVRIAARRGVTLLELLVVLAIMALVAAIVIPMVRGPACRRPSCDSAARQLASGLRLARSEAVAQRRETFLVIDLDGRRFKVDRDAREHRAAAGRRAQALHRAEGPRRRQGRLDPLLSRRRQQRRPHHARRPASANTKSTSTGSPAASRSSIDDAAASAQPRRRRDRAARLLAARGAGRVRDPRARRDGAVPPLLLVAQQRIGGARSGAARCWSRSRGSTPPPPRSRCARATDRGTDDDGRVQWETA